VAERPHRGAWHEIREFGVLVLIALVVAIVLKTFIVQAFFIPSVSMVPTLQVGDRVLVCRICTRIGDIDRGDVVVFSDPTPGSADERGILGGALHWLGEGLGLAQPADEDFIKRVIGLPGDTWEIRSGRLYVNGRRVREPYVNPEGRDTRSFGPDRVPDDMLFVMGDNRLYSGDSRFDPPEGLGYVPRDNVIGEAVVVVWPPSRAGGIDG
jgi:signal peptidase I